MKKHDWLLVGALLAGLPAFAAREIIVVEKTGASIQQAINAVAAGGGGA